MHIQDIFQAHPTTFSFEFFPPKTDEASEVLFANIAQLQVLRPSFVSVTYGAGGSTRERTHDLVVRIQRETDLTAVSHLTCVCHSRDELAAILDRYAASGIDNILALGARFPARLLKAIDRCAGDPEAIDRVGIHWATEQCRDLLDHQVRGLHFYTLNRSDATRRIYENLGVLDSAGLRGAAADESALRK